MILFPDESSNLLATDNSADEISWIFVSHWIRITGYFY